MLTLRRARAYALVVILIFATVYAVGILRRSGLVDGFGHIIGGDLLTPRMAARIVLDGRGAELYDFSLQGEYQQAAAGPQRLPGMIPFFWPPFVAVLYVPWALVPQGPALVLWTAFSLACLVTALLVMARAAPLTGRHWPSTLLLSLSFYPVLEGLMAGNDSLIALPIFALTYRALRAGNEATAGALLGLQFYRPQLAVAPLILFAAKGRWRILTAAAAVGAAWGLLSALCVGPRALLDWLALAPELNRMIFEPGMPHALLSSVSALFLLPLGPQHLGAGMVAGTVASLGLLALLLRIWAGPWEPRADCFDHHAARAPPPCSPGSAAAGVGGAGHLARRREAGVTWTICPTPSTRWSSRRAEPAGHDPSPPDDAGMSRGHRAGLADRRHAATAVVQQGPAGAVSFGPSLA